eukprot:scaffold225205_cov14-Tisochrysis_lutea.AAC.1
MASSFGPKEELERPFLFTNSRAWATNKLSLFQSRYWTGWCMPRAAASVLYLQLLKQRVLGDET